MPPKKKTKDKYCLYRHKKSCGGVFYIGIGNLKRPFKKQNRSKFWKNITDKEEYFIEILKYDLSWDEACELEQILIGWYGRRDLGQGSLVNLTDGGEGCVGNVHSEETKLKMSLAKKGKYKGQNNWNYGRIITEEHRYKISEGKKGEKRTKEQTERRLKRHSLNPMPKKVRQKISESTKCGKNYKSKKIINTVTKEIHDCVQEVANILDMPKTTLTGWLNGTYTNKSCYLYLENYNEG